VPKGDVVAGYSESPVTVEQLSIPTSRKSTAQGAGSGHYCQARLRWISGYTWFGGGVFDIHLQQHEAGASRQSGGRKVPYPLVRVLVGF
jgi:hypothetical protein